MNKNLLYIFNAFVCFVCLVFFPGNSYPENTTESSYSVFEKYKQLNNELKEAIKLGNHIQIARKKLESYHEEVYIPFLNKVKEDVCKKRDEDLFLSFIDVLLHSSNSADERPVYLLGEIYICQPDLVKKSFNNLPCCDQEYIYGLLKFGFLNVADNDRSKILNFMELNEGIKSIQPCSQKNDNFLH